MDEAVKTLAPPFPDAGRNENGSIVGDLDVTTASQLLGAAERAFAGWAATSPSGTT